MNLVDRPTRTAAELEPAELQAGATQLVELGTRYRPTVVAVPGLTAWRWAFDATGAGIGRQVRPIGGAVIWVLPNRTGPPRVHVPRPASGHRGEPVVTR